MKCDSCNEREATIAFTRISGDDKQVLHLCAHCAEHLARQEKGTGQEMDGGSGETSGKAADNSSGKAAAPGGPGAGQGAAPKPPGKAAESGADKPPIKKVSVVVGHLSGTGTAPTCPGCGMTYEEFRKVGRFGCAKCYTAFAGQLQRLLKRVHGAVRHVGKAPTGAEPSGAPAPEAGAVGSRRRRPSAAPQGAGTSQELEQLRQELQEAVAAEAYERAAELRDRIAQLEAGAAAAAGEAEDP